MEPFGVTYYNCFNPSIVWNNPFRVDAPLTEKPSDSFAQTETELPQNEILSKDARHFFTFFFRCFSHVFGFCYTLIFIYKQLWSGLSSRSCLYSQGFLGSKLQLTSLTK